MRLTTPLKTSAECRRWERLTSWSNPILAGLRSWAVKGFEDMRIYYVVQDDVLRVVRVLHGKRDINKILKREDNEQSRQ